MYLKFDYTYGHRSEFSSTVLSDNPSSVLSNSLLVPLHFPFVSSHRSCVHKIPIRQVGINGQKLEINFDAVHDYQEYDNMFANMVYA